MTAYDSLPVLIRTVRSSQKISQAALAASIGKKQASVAQYETFKAKLSSETLRKAAAFLNMSPAYIETLEGNPFQAKVVNKKQELIRLLMPETATGEADYDFLRFVLEKSGDALVVLLKAEDERDAGWTAGCCAILLRDGRGNFFLLRRKDPDAAFPEMLVKNMAGAVSKASGGYFEVRVISLEKDLLEKIRSWSQMSINDIQPLLEKTKFSRHIENRSFMEALLKRMRRKGASTEEVQARLDQMESKLGLMKPDQLERAIAKLLSGLEKIIEEEDLL